MDYDKAIELYSSAIDLNCSCSTDTMFEQRCKARLGKMLWADALLDAQKPFVVSWTSAKARSSTWSTTV
ncbi:hypothetical protein AZE42_12871 [Rhizopogon vesiculosus]|uniref:Uncharacterized protein n=1 Tax=Rhizopogon vesiculosus TaxID=180088 RepID=A0A1J8PWE9_9AGAM|nr:hypothetical protein AZE42_12871 [Rhizopogon vesiculosus]